jgi:hypothetical protein
MRAGIVVNVTGAVRRQLEAIISDRSAPQKHVWRAIIILAAAPPGACADPVNRSLWCGDGRCGSWEANVRVDPLALIHEQADKKPRKACESQ